MLFPRGRANHLLPAHREINLPGRNWFTLDDVGPVDEHITVIYAQAPVPYLESLRDLNIPAKVTEVPLQTLAMSSLRGVVLDPTEQVELSVINPLEDHMDFTGRHDVNSVDFILSHQGVQPR